jgi:DNA repair exonuclease SbcCD ATPase subunit
MAFKDLVGDKRRTQRERLQDAPPPPEAAAGEAAVTAGTELDRLREILMGDRVRGLEGALNGVQERLDATDALLREELDKLRRSLHEEREERDKAEASLLEKLETKVRKLETRLGEVESKSDSAVGDLRGQLLGQFNLLSETFRQRHDAMLEQLDQRLDEVNALKTDRSTLAELLTDLAGRLRGDPSPEPAAEGKPS